MKQYNGIFQTMAVTAVMLLAACNSEGDSTVTDGLQPVPLQIATSIDVAEQTVTRAADSHWETGDKIGVFAVKASSGTNYTAIDDRYNGTNNPYVFSDGLNTEASTTYRTFTTTNPVFIEDGETIHVYAYYPYNSSASLSATAIPIDVLTQTPQKDIDFMRASATTTTQVGSTAITRNNPSCELKFEHKLCKVQFNIKAGAGFSSAEAATATNMTIAGQATTGKYNIYTDVLTISGGTPDIVACPMATATGFDASFEAIILPNGTDNAAADRTLSVTLGKGTSTHTYTCTLPVTGPNGIPSFTAGNKYTVNITLASTGLSVTCAIQPWTTAADVAGTATH